MDLLEHQGKALFRRYGIPVPDGVLWPTRPGWTGPSAVKAQVRGGRRGKAGGIRFADTVDDAAAAAETLAGGGPLAGHPVEAVYVEARLDIAREAYLAIALDRDRRRLMLLASAKGGVDVEAAQGDAMLRLPLDPLLGLRDFHVAAAVRAIGADDTVQGEITGGIVRAAYALARGEDAELVEINPLALTRDGRVLAADSKVVLDDNAAFRRGTAPNAAPPSAPTSGSPLEARIAETGAVGIEIDPDGDVVAVVSGAGLMMATLDTLRDAGLRVRLVVDLGGAVLAGGEVLGRVFQAVSSGEPRVTFLNAFLHTALCDEFARMLADAQERAPLTGRVLIRLKGRNAETGRALLGDHSFEVYENLGPAVAALTGVAVGQEAL